VEDLFCEKCKRKTTFSKKTDLYTTPEFLIIHLVRFTHWRSSNEKITTAVEYKNQVEI
jgi:ubiquitin C-terminal hydrolase